MAPFKVTTFKLCDIIASMLRLRRIIRFSGRVQSFLVLLTFFVFALFLIQLWGLLTPQFYTVISNGLIFLIYLGFAYGVVIIILTLLLGAISSVFLWGEVLKILGKSLLLSLILTFVSLFTTLTQGGIVFTIWGGKMEQRVVAIRGAIQVTADTQAAIREGTERLFYAICMANTLLEEEIISIMFSLTPDLRSLNPATALREGYPSLQVPLFCTQEALIEGMLERTIRVIIHCYTSREEVQHIYLEGAANLRRDLSSNYSWHIEAKVYY